jgi:folate-binding Fe-S cluster repair protein YgfZ
MARCGDHDRQTIPAETGLSAVAVNFKKGCYRGPEIRRADGQSGRGGAAVVAGSTRRERAAGDQIVGADGNEVGVLTTVSGTRALGYETSSDVGEPVTQSSAAQPAQSGSSRNTASLSVIDRMGD